MTATMTRNPYRPQEITTVLIKRLAKREPPERPREIRDKHARLILRHESRGALTLYANLGRRTRQRICDARKIIDPQSEWTLGKAKSDARKLKVQHDDGHDFSAERKAKRAVPTLKCYLADTHGPWLKANRRSGPSTLARIESCFSDDFDNLKLTEIDQAQLDKWLTKRRKKKVKNETIGRDIGALHAALNRAVRLKIISANPIAGYERLEVDKHKRSVRALTAAEKEALLEALRARDDTKRAKRSSANDWRAQRNCRKLPTIGQYCDTLTPAVIVSLETGLRRGELFALQWPQVDLKSKRLNVKGETAKTFETREIPLSDSALKALRTWWMQQGQPKEGFVFTTHGKRIGNLKRSYNAVLSTAGIEQKNSRDERVTWHSLRHTFGSLLGAANVDPTTLMHLMGHADLATTQRYLHTDQERKRAAIELLGCK